MMGSMTANSQKHWTGDVAELLRVGRGVRALGTSIPSRTPGYADGKSARRPKTSPPGAEQLDELQERLYAQSRVDATDASVLLVLQAMDSAGKGGIIRHVVGSVDPQGVTLDRLQEADRPRSSRTTSSGGSSSACRSRASSACSTGRTTRTC